MKNYQQEERFIKAQKKLKKIKGFYGHLFWYLVINLFLLGFMYYNFDPKSEFWSPYTFSTAFFWGIGLMFHALGVFGTQWFFGKTWEDRKIKEFMDKERKNDERRS